MTVDVRALPIEGSTCAGPHGMRPSASQSISMDRNNMRFFVEPEVKPIRGRRATRWELSVQLCVVAVAMGVCGVGAGTS